MERQAIDPEIRAFWCSFNRAGEQEVNDRSFIWNPENQRLRLRYPFILISAPVLRLVSFSTFNNIQPVTTLVPETPEALSIGSLWFYLNFKLFQLWDSSKRRRSSRWRHDPMKLHQSGTQTILKAVSDWLCSVSHGYEISEAPTVANQYEARRSLRTLIPRPCSFLTVPRSTWSLSFPGQLIKSYAEFSCNPK